MAYTEIKERKGKKYYYRVQSIRQGKNVHKKRVYLGMNLIKKKITQKEQEADKQLLLLNHLLTEEEIKLLKHIQQSYAKEPKENWNNRYEAFCALFTYNSNAIEGNTLTLQQTSHLLFEHIVPAHKSLREINEALNHKKAFDYILNYKEDITKEFILQLHTCVVKDTLRKELEAQIGTYRTVQVFIRGAQTLPPTPEQVPQEMQSLLTWYTKNKKRLHPLVVAAYFHAAFEGIHPFIDGNGRVGRLLMNFILHKSKYPMINMLNKMRYNYYKSLEEAQIKGNLRPFIELLLSIVKKNKMRL